MNTGAIIDKLARERNKNIHQLSVEAGVPYNTLYAIVKRNSAKVSPDIIHRVAAVLEVPDYALLSGNDGKVIDSEQTPEAAYIKILRDAWDRLSLITFLMVLASPDVYADLPDENKGRLAANCRTLLAHARILCAKNPLTDDDVSDYRTEQFLKTYQQSILKTGLETSKNYGKWLRHISQIICRYATLNADGRKELEKRLGELERLEEYESDILTTEVKKIVEETFKWD